MAVGKVAVEKQLVPGNGVTEVGRHPPSFYLPQL